MNQGLRVVPQTTRHCITQLQVWIGSVFFMPLIALTKGRPDVCFRPEFIVRHCIRFPIWDRNIYMARSFLLCHGPDPCYEAELIWSIASVFQSQSEFWFEPYVLIWARTRWSYKTDLIRAYRVRSSIGIGVFRMAVCYMLSLNLIYS